MRRDNRVINTVRCGAPAILLLLMTACFPVLGGGGSITLAAGSDSGWVEQEVPVTEGEATAVTAVDTATAWTAFSPATSPGSEILKTQDGGSHWFTQVLDGNYGYTTTDAYAVDEDIVWSIASGSIYKSVNGGGTWSNVHQGHGTPASVNIAMDICASDGNTAWSVEWMSLWYGSTYGWSVIRTQDGGSNWYSVLSLNGPMSPVDCLSSIDIADDSTLWLSLYGPSQAVLRSVDGGTNWDNHALEGWIIYDICAIDAYTAWAVGGEATSQPGTGAGVILMTDDGGATWVMQHRVEGHSLSGISAADASTAWAVGELNAPDYASADAGVILKTEDGGTTWDTQYEFTGGGYISDIAAASASTAWAVGKNSSGGPLILNTINGGYAQPGITAVSPGQAMQYTLAVNLTIIGNGFMPGATARLDKAGKTIAAVSTTVDSSTQLVSAFSLFEAEPGVYDVVVVNPDGGESRLPGAFTVTSLCGTGSGTALLVPGLILGLLSLAGTAGVKKRKRTKLSDREER